MVERNTCIKFASNNNSLDNDGESCHPGGVLEVNGIATINKKKKSKKKIYKIYVSKVTLKYVSRIFAVYFAALKLVSLMQIFTLYFALIN